MFGIRAVFSKFGFANILSLLSLIVSITCFAFMARISQQYAKINLNKVEPKVIIANNETVKVAIDKNNYDIDATVYDNIVQDIDKISTNKDQEYDVKIKVANKPKIEAIEEVKPDEIGAKEVNKGTDNSINLDLNQDIKKGANTKNTVQLGVFKSHREAVSSWFKMTEKYVILNGIRYQVVSKNNMYLLQVKEKNPQNAEKLLSSLQEQGLKASLVG